MIDKSARYIISFLYRFMATVLIVWINIGLYPNHFLVRAFF